jgi:transcriptional regulator with XRE-family HTH domain
MPKLIIDRRNPRPRKGPKAPPCGRVIPFFEPHSPFQRLIDARRRERELSTRALAKEIGVPPSNVYVWLHGKNGFPYPRSFPPATLRKLASVLDLPASDIEKSIDASRLLYSQKEIPMPLASRDAFKRFIGVLQNDRRQTVTLSYVINLARTMYNGATGEKI